MLRAMWEAVREERTQRKKGREVLGYLEIPQAVGRYSHDQINLPGRRRAARWADAPGRQGRKKRKGPR